MTQAAPSGDANRRRFVRALASLDPNVMIDGGWLTPLGQEDELREIIAIYRRLPAAEFQLLPEVAQPVKVRWLSFGHETYVCLLNDSPWRTTVSVRLELPDGCRGERLGLSPAEVALRRDAGGASWEVALRPYDVVAARFSSPDVVVSHPQVEVDQADLARLRARVDDLLSRAAGLNQPAPYATLPNAGFEQPAEQDDTIPAWQFSAQPGAGAALDAEQKFSGARSVRLQSDGPLATLVSQPIAPPRTGRLAVWVRLRIADAEAQPPLRLAVEARLRGREYYRHAPVGQGANVVKLTAPGPITCSPSTICRLKVWPTSVCGSI